jgi:hypothetical protein
MDVCVRYDSQAEAPLLYIVAINDIPFLVLQQRRWRWNDNGGVSPHSTLDLHSA